MGNKHHKSLFCIATDLENTHRNINAFFDALAVAMLGDQSTPLTGELVDAIWHEIKTLHGQVDEVYDFSFAMKEKRA